MNTKVIYRRKLMNEHDDTCFFLGVRKRKKAWERKTRLSRHRNLFKTQVNDCFSSFSQSSASLKSLQSHIYIECQINEQLISRALDIKVSEEDVGPKECDCLINNIRSVCICCLLMSKLNKQTKQKLKCIYLLK